MNILVKKKLDIIEPRASMHVGVTKLKTTTIKQRKVFSFMVFFSPSLSRCDLAILLTLGWRRTSTLCHGT